MSGAVGSIPSFTRRGRPSSSWVFSAPSGSASTAFLSRKSASSLTGAMVCSPAPRTDHLGRRPLSSGRLRTHSLARRLRAHMQKTIEPTRLPQTAPPPPPVDAAACGPVRRRRRRAARATEAEEAARRARRRRPRLHRLHLGDLRDDDGRRVRDPEPRERGPVQERRELDPLADTEDEYQLGEADGQREPHPRRRGRDLARTSRTPSSRSRTSASTSTAGSTTGASGVRSIRTSSAAARSRAPRRSRSSS